MVAYFSDGAQVALLNWVNTFNPEPKARSLEDLQDGLLFGKVLETLSAPGGFNSSTLSQTPASWPDKMQNLETVNRALTHFLREENLGFAITPSQFRAMVDDPNRDAMCEISSVLLSAASLGSTPKRFVPNIMNLSQKDQMELAPIIRRMMEKTEVRKREQETQLPAGASGHEPAAHITNPDLAQEVELSGLHRQIETLKREKADLLTRHDKLVQNHAQLNEKLRRTQTELETQLKAASHDAPLVIQALEKEKQDCEWRIDELQSQVTDLTQSLDKLKVKNETLETVATTVEDLQDKVKELQHENKELEKAKASLENYKRKAQEVAGYQRELAQLREQINELRDVEHRLFQYQADALTQERTIKGFRERVGGYEKEIFEKSKIIRTLQAEVQDSQARVSVLIDQISGHENHIKELEDRIQLGGHPSAPDSPDASSAHNLEHELESIADPENALHLELARLRAENRVLRNNLAGQAEAQRLREDLNMANRKADHFMSQCSDAVEKQAFAEEQVNALLSSLPADRVDALAKLRLQVLQATEELNEARSAKQKLGAQVSDKDRELLSLRTRLDAIGKEAVEALDMTKHSDQVVLHSHKVELEATRSKLELEGFDNEQVRKQLMDTLVSKDKIREQLDELRDNLANSAQTPASEDGQKPKEDSEKTEKLKAALKTKMQQLEQSEKDRYDLQQRVKAFESGGAYAAQKAATDQIINNLQRENAMITTAWYDVTSRLQSDHVVLQRRNDTRKSWLHKQRMLVIGTPRR